MVGDVLTLIGHVAIAFAAGMLLNFTPCVLPAIPIKIRTILRESGSETSHRILAALAFFSGVMVFFLPIAGLTALLHWNWGALFQSQAVIAVLVAILVGFAVLTWLDIPIPVPSFVAQTRGHHYLEAFLSGLFSSILAAPCAGPFLGGVLVYAVTQPTSVIFLLFASVGTGLAAPYILLLINPHWLRRLPRSGPWADAVRQALAFVLLAAAVFFGNELLAAQWHRYLWWSWFAAVALWACWQLFTPGWGRRLVALAVWGAAGILTNAMVSNMSPGGQEGIPWQAYTPALVTRVLQKGNPVLIEFTADWCINCKVLEQTVYSDSTVAALLRQRRVEPIQVDLTHSSPSGEALMASLGGHALPFAVVVGANGQPSSRFTGLFLVDELKLALVKASRDQGTTQ